MAIANAVNGPEAAPYLAKAGGTMTGALNMGTHLINGVVDPVSAQDAATKYYVDTVAQGLNPKPSSAAASTTALTVTYSNGSSGVGATLTNAGAQAALVIDGYSAAVNDVILIKDQASSLQNGLYTVTDIGSGATNWVLTRSVYMDAPSEFKGGYTFVINGTVNAGRSYVETATVSAVGTDAVTFVQFSQSKQLTLNVQTFNAGSSTYTPSSGMIYCTTELVAGGGSGGGASSSGAGNGSGGGGGAAGGYCRKLYTAANIGASAAVVVGVGGAAPSAGANPGNAGTNSTFTCSGTGATLTATGGAAGSAGTSSATANVSAISAAGGTGTNGDVNIPGQRGAAGWCLAAGVLGAGGSGGSPGGGLGLGGTFNCNVGNSGGVGGTGYGAGGDGALALSADRAGAAGKDGICIVTEYINS